MPSRSDRLSELRQKTADRTRRRAVRRASWNVRWWQGLWAVALSVAAIGLFEAGSDAGLPPAASVPIDAARNAAPPDTGRASVPLTVPAHTVRPATTWQRHAVAAPAALGRPVITIVIDDMGVDQTRSRATIELPPPLTTAFLPYGRHTPRLAKLARAGGHELLVHLPMAPDDHGMNPGPHALRSAMEPAALKAGLDWNLGRLDGYVGVNNHMGSAFTADREAMHRVLAELAGRGLLFLDSRTTRHSAAVAAGRGLDMPILQRDVFLDNVRAERAIWRRLMEVERIARRKGRAIAIGHPYPETINALSVWLPRLEARGFVLVPLSAQAKRLDGPDLPLQHARAAGR